MLRMKSGALGWIRIAFGVVWAIDAYLKWQPYFLSNLGIYLSNNLSGQPAFVAAWLNLWLRIISINPFAFAIAIALLETAIAIALIFGVGKRTTTIVGILLSLLIWSTAESFGGPYTAGSTDIGAAVIYIFVFLALYFSAAWEECRVRFG